MLKRLFLAFGLAFALGGLSAPNAYAADVYIATYINLDGKFYYVSPDSGNTLFFLYPNPSGWPEITFNNAMLYQCNRTWTPLVGKWNFNVYYYGTSIDIGPINTISWRKYAANGGYVMVITVRTTSGDTSCQYPYPAPYQYDHIFTSSFNS